MATAVDFYPIIKQWFSEAETLRPLLNKRLVDLTPAEREAASRCHLRVYCTRLFRPVTKAEPIMQHAYVAELTERRMQLKVDDLCAQGWMSCGHSFTRSIAHLEREMI